MAYPRENRLYGVRIFHDTKHNILGASELPPDFVAFRKNQVMIAGKPSADVLQLAFSELGFVRANVNRYPRGERVTGLLLDLVA